LADLIRKNPDAIKKLASLANESNTLTTTIINSAELFYGAYKSNNVNREKEKVKLVLSRFIILDLDEDSAEKFGELCAKLDVQGQKIADKDMLIASVAIAKGEKTVVTRNTKDFERIPNLTVLTY
jgi:tRNA(fMet)-specific endonuclease VapC